MGTGRMLRDGYVYILAKDHPKAAQSGYVAEHRLVMEQHIGRALFEHENVHHKFGDRADNRIERLELWSTSQPSGQRVVDKLQWAREFIALYEPDADESIVEVRSQASILGDGYE